MSFGAILFFIFGIFLRIGWWLGKKVVLLRRKDGNRVAWAIAMQGNPVRVRNCTCSCNPLKHRVCLLNVTGRNMAGKAKQTGEKSEDLPSLKKQ